LSDGPLTPEMLIPERWKPFYRDMSNLLPVRGQLLPVLYPFVTIPWMEGIMGCPIRVSLDSHSMGADPCLEDLADLVFSLLILGDDRAVFATHILGEPVNTQLSSQG